MKKVAKFKDFIMAAIKPSSKIGGKQILLVAMVM